MCRGGREKPQGHQVPESIGEVENHCGCVGILNKQLSLSATEVNSDRSGCVTTESKHHPDYHQFFLRRTCGQLIFMNIPKITSVESLQNVSGLQLKQLIATESCHEIHKETQRNTQK